MPLYLNQDNSRFDRSLNSEIYIDKSMLIKECNKRFNTEDCYMCVTRPRRFGKSMALAMLNAYYSKGCDSKELFSNLKISNAEFFKKHLNKHNVIWIDMAELYTSLKDKSLFVDKLKEYIFYDLKQTFKNVDINFDMSDGTYLINSFKIGYIKTK